MGAQNGKGPPTPTHMPLAWGCPMHAGHLSDRFKDESAGSGPQPLDTYPAGPALASGMLGQKWITLLAEDF